MSAQRSRMLAQVVAHVSAGLGKALAMRQQPPLPGLVVAHRRTVPVKGARPCRASNPQRGAIEPAPSPAFRPLSRRSHPARARALARLAGRGPAPRSRTAPSRERCMGCRRGSHCRACRRRRACRRPRRHLPPPPRRDASRRRRRHPRHRRSPASLTCVAHLRRHRHRPRHRRSPNRAAVSRRAAYASPRASNLTSATMVTYLPRPPLLCRRASPRRHRCRRRHRRHCVPRIAAVTPPRLASSPPPLSPPPPPSLPSSLSPSSSPLCVAPTARPRAAVPRRPCRLVAIAATLHVTPAALPRCCASPCRY